jgi:hypothetical protein
MTAIAHILPCAVEAEVFAVLIYLVAHARDALALSLAQAWWRRVTSDG